ncbi:hypothetical protein, partial [Enterococcus faecium]
EKSLPKKQNPTSQTKKHKFSNTSPPSETKKQPTTKKVPKKPPKKPSPLSQLFPETKKTT